MNLPKETIWLECLDKTIFVFLFYKKPIYYYLLEYEPEYRKWHKPYQRYKDLQIS